MTNLQPRTEKLRARSVRSLMAEAGLDGEAARAALDSAGGDLRAALVMAKTGATREEAERALDESHGVVTRAAEIIMRDE
ncbi:MAG TPA: hypothetical protein VER32_06690 [Pyrinomonadaceae bacterium]|nr:hypothetical protein [Pyrinomonadaceae bacterium]